MINHIDLARAFVTGTHRVAKCGEMRFDGSKAYSYDVLIARKHNGVMLINNMPYSTSTSAHRGKIRRQAEAAGMTIIEVPNLHFEHEQNLQYFRGLRRELQRRLERATKPKPIHESIAAVERDERLYLTVFPNALSGKEAA